MLKKIKYYLRKVGSRLAEIFSKRRIKRFGFRIAFLDLVIYMCHRSASDFQLMIIRAKDRIVQKYIYKNYEGILEKYREG